MQAQKEFGLIVLPQRFVFLLYFDNALKFFFCRFFVLFQLKRQKSCLKVFNIINVIFTTLC